MKHYIAVICVLLISITSLNGCSVANVLRMMRANNDLVPKWPSNKKQQILDALYIGEKPYIKVKANDNTELLFLIDTGASFSMVFDTEIGKSIAHKKGFDLSIQGWGDGENTPAYQTELNSLNIGEVTFNDVKVAYIPISTSQYYLNNKEAIFDGVLGHDLMKHFSWTFDKKVSKITISSEGYKPKSTDSVVPFDVSFSKLSIPAIVKFNETEFVEKQVIIDTGSRHYLKLSSTYPRNNDITLPETKVRAADFGMSGVALHERITLPNIQIGDVVFTNVKTNLIKSDDEDDWWVIGSALMNQYVTIIDYHNNNFIIQEDKEKTFATKFNLAGLDIRKLTNGNLFVRYVYPDLPAKASGLKQGDEIESINGIDANSLSEEDWLTMATKPATFNICKVKADCKKFTTKHIEGYSDF